MIEQILAKFRSFIQLVGRFLKKLRFSLRPALSYKTSEAIAISDCESLPEYKEDVEKFKTEHVGPLKYDWKIWTNDIYWTLSTVIITCEECGKTFVMRTFL